MEISKATEVKMYVVAGLFDLMQFGLNFIPVMGNFLAFLLSIFAWLTFYTWFKIYNISIFSPLNILLGITEAIPILNDLPAFLGLVVKNMIDIKKQKVLSYIPGGKILTPMINRRIDSSKMLKTRNIELGRNKNNSKVVTMNKKPEVYNNDIKKVA